MASRSRELGRHLAKSILCKLQLGPEGQISNLSCCRFTRRYWGNPCWFLFLRLLICLSSAGIPTWSEVNLEKVGGFTAGAAPARQMRDICYYAGETRRDRHWISGACVLARRRPQHQAQGLEGWNDARTGMPARILAGAMCVQRFDDSLNSAIHITYRISLRSSSMPEPRDPLLKVLTYLLVNSEDANKLTRVWCPPAGAWSGARKAPGATRRSNR